MKPDRVNILGIEYSILYVNPPPEVDVFKRQSLWGQIDYWTRTIRIYENDRKSEDIFQTIIHEVIHGISEELKLVLMLPEHHDDLDILSIALADVLFRNGWISP